MKIQAPPVIRSTRKCTKVPTYGQLDWYQIVPAMANDNSRHHKIKYNDRIDDYLLFEFYNFAQQVILILSDC